MAVFVAGTDESAGKDHRSTFFRGGFVAPEPDWSQWFAPAWQERVLDGPPQIPYLHMTDIRSRPWRAKYGLSDTAAERRVEEAFRVIHSMGSMFPVTSHLDAGHFRDAFSTVKLLHRKATTVLEPDFVCFLAFAYTVLSYVDYAHPDAEKVDFIIEHNGSMTKYIADFYRLMRPTLEQDGHAPWTRLIGDLIPGGKECVPLQAADVLCWHAQRREADTLSLTDGRRYAKLAHRKGVRHEWTREEITDFARSAVLANSISEDESSSVA